jgi:diacylglycerol kinase (ATP)
MKPGKTGVARIIDATHNSMKGLKACWIHEAAFRQDVALSAVLFLSSFFVATSPEQWLLLIFPPFLLMITELLNSAIENVVDRIGHERHELSGRAKDVGSAAVFLCLCLTTLVWFVVIWRNFFQ